MEKDVIQKAYGGGAPQYDGVMAIEWEPTTPRHEIMAWLELPPQGKLLDVCVGTGLSFPYYPRGAQVTGIDFTDGMLAVAKQKASQLRREIELHLMDAMALKFPDSSFDAVLETYALCVVPDPEKALREMARVCRPGGKVVVFDCILSDIPAVAKNQCFVQPLCATIGIPAGIIVWDPTRDYTEIAARIPSLKLNRIMRYDQGDLFKSRCLIQFERL
jgi:ubiquinone/menaquinone biosynthesis C-methylase UbiE